MPLSVRNAYHSPRHKYLSRPLESCLRSSTCSPDWTNTPPSARMWQSDLILKHPRVNLSGLAPPTHHPNE